jgi:hypothetical protein
MLRFGYGRSAQVQQESTRAAVMCFHLDETRLLLLVLSAKQHDSAEIDIH